MRLDITPYSDYSLILKFPILKWIIATPEFHHWHHDRQPQLYAQNLAVQLPILDYIFGTWHMPDYEFPKQYGTELNTETNYFNHLIYPFKHLFKTKRI